MTIILYFIIKKKIEEKKLEGGKERWAWEWGFFLKFTTENDEIGIFVYKEKYVKKKIIIMKYTKMKCNVHL